MTKKSAGRIARDQANKQQNFSSAGDSSSAGWDDLDGIYNAAVQTLLTANDKMIELFKTPGVMLNVPNNQECVISIRGLDKDLKFFADELKSIRAQHEGKTGKTVDEDETILCLNLFERYVAFHQRYNSVIIPTITYLAEQAGEAVRIMQALYDKQIALQGVNDPTVITDVVAKDVKVEEVSLSLIRPQFVDSYMPSTINKN